MRAVFWSSVHCTVISSLHFKYFVLCLGRYILLAFAFLCVQNENKKDSMRNKHDDSVRLSSHWKNQVSLRVYVLLFFVFFSFKELTIVGSSSPSTKPKHRIVRHHAQSVSFRIFIISDCLFRIIYDKKGEKISVKTPRHAQNFFNIDNG